MTTSSRSLPPRPDRPDYFSVAPRAHRRSTAQATVVSSITRQTVCDDRTTNGGLRFCEQRRRIEHLGNPWDRLREVDEWRDELSELGPEPGVERVL